MRIFNHEQTGDAFPHLYQLPRRRLRRLLIIGKCFPQREIKVLAQRGKSTKTAACGRMNELFWVKNGALTSRSSHVIGTCCNVFSQVKVQKISANFSESCCMLRHESIAMPLSAVLSQGMTIVDLHFEGEIATR